MAELVDISSFFSDDSSPSIAAQRAAVVDAFRRDLCECGFIRLTGHCIAPAVLQQAFDAAHTFFRSPIELKRTAYSQDRARRGFSDLLHENYASLMGQQAPNDAVEKFRMGPPALPGDAADAYFNCKEGRTHFFPNSWPDDGGSLEPATTSYFQQMEQLSMVLLRIIEAALELDAGYFEGKMSRHTSILAVNYFPTGAREAEEEDRIAPHTDVSLITVVAHQQGGDGLQIRTPDQQWVNVPAEAGQLVLNIGDCLMDWTAGRAKSTVHRVTGNPASGAWQERLSMAYFVTPDHDAILDGVGAQAVGVPYSKWRKKRIKEAMKRLPHSS